MQKKDEKAEKKSNIEIKLNKLELTISEILTEISSQNAGVEFKYEASVGGSMPIINFTKETLSSCKIESIKGIS